MCNHSVHLPLSAGMGCVGRGWCWASYQIFKKGGLAGSQFWEVITRKEGGYFFQGGLQFLHKNKLKYEIFNEKKSL